MGVGGRDVTQSRGRARACRAASLLLFLQQARGVALTRVYHGASIWTSLEHQRLSAGAGPGLRGCLSQRSAVFPQLSRAGAQRGPALAAHEPGTSEQVGTKVLG